MTLTQLKYVITIAECGSMNKAAELLYVAQPSLTGAVKELEKELGFPLFNRSGRGVTLTADGADFIPYARDVVGRYEILLEKFGEEGIRKKKFGVSTQHYSFAVKAFVEMVKTFDISEYEFAIRETMTKQVISDVASMRSEIGILYLSDFNRRAINKLLSSANLEFHHLIDCDVSVYLWRGHPLANKKYITEEELSPYPCLSFEQGDTSSFYFAEEILPTNNYPRLIKANDRATMLNLMIGLLGYTLCSGIVYDELNGDDYLAVPYRMNEDDNSGVMEIGYISQKGRKISSTGELYIAELKKHLGVK